MNEVELQKLIEAINKSTTTTVESVVNGKIKRMDDKLSEYIHNDLKWKEEKVEPLIDAHRTIKNLGIFLKWSAGIVVAVTVLFKVFTLKEL